MACSTPSAAAAAAGVAACAAAVTACDTPEVAAAASVGKAVIVTLTFHWGPAGGRGGPGLLPTLAAAVAAAGRRDRVQQAEMMERASVSGAECVVAPLAAAMAEAACLPPPMPAG
eukprot:484140-Pelagomonas_calceolata.AAC.3